MFEGTVRSRKMERKAALRKMEASKREWVLGSVGSWSWRIVNPKRSGMDKRCRYGGIHVHVEVAILFELRRVLVYCPF